MPVAVLAADLAELAGPVRQDSGKTAICELGIGGASRAIEASAEGPAAIRAVFGGGIEAEGVLRLESFRGRQLVARAPEELVAEEERMIDGAAKRLPTQ